MSFGKLTLTSRRAIFAGCIAGALSLVYFFLTYHFYEAVTVHVRGTSPAPFQAELFFDTGNGLTEYEHIPLTFDPPSGSPGANATGGEFHGSSLLPYQPFKKFRLDLTSGDAASIHLDKIEAEWLGGKAELPILGFGKPSPELHLPTRVFHRGLFLLHVVLSIFVGWLVWLAGTLPDRLDTFTWRRTCQKIFLEDGRPFFWIIFAAASATYTLWLLTYWPAATTSDSWSSLYEVSRLYFNNWHPYIYGLYLLVLMQFGGSPAAVALFQIVITAGTGAWIFYYCRQRGVRMIYLLPFALLFILSIPIGLFNIILWKDVPFSIAVFLVSFLIFRAQYVRETAGRLPLIPRWSLPLLALMGVLLLHSRHNGAVFYLVLPVLLFRRVSRRDFGLLLGFLTFAYTAINVAIPKVFHIPKITGSAYHEVRTALAIMTHFNYYSDDHALDQKIMADFTGEKWERLNELFPRHWFTISSLPRMNYWQFTQDPRDPNGFNTKFLAHLIAHNIPIFLEARFYDFFHSLALDTSDSNVKNDFYEDPLQLQGNDLSPPGRYRWYSLPAEEKWPAIAGTIKKIDSWSRQYTGLRSPLVLIWNLAIYYGLFLFVLYLEKASSPISLYIMPSLAATASVFVVGAGESWRYFYYVYLTGLFLIPLYLAYEKREKLNNC